LPPPALDAGNPVVRRLELGVVTAERSQSLIVVSDRSLDFRLLTQRQARLGQLPPETFEQHVAEVPPSSLKPGGVEPRG
jgi:hypothetical protein